LSSLFVKTRIVRGLQKPVLSDSRMDRERHLAFAIGAVAVAVRLIAIDQPYIDNWSWRQSDVAAIARNFYNNGFHFAYPQIDWAGDAPGYVGTEFPILPFIAAITYKFLGVHEWIGRGQAVIFFTASLPFFFLLVREIFGSAAAIWALFFYSFAPLNIFAGREFMPDVPSLGLAMIGLYLFLRWIDNNNLGSFIGAAITISLSILIKATSAVIGAPLLYLAVAVVYDRRWSFQRECDGHRPRLQLLAVFAAITLLPSVIWYWHAYEIAQNFYPYHFFGAGGVQIMSTVSYWKIAKQIITSSLTPLLFGLALIGAFVTSPVMKAFGTPTRLVAVSTRRSALFHWWLAAIVASIIVVGYGNRHQWYQLPLVPVAAAFAGAGCVFVGSKISARKMNVALSAVIGLLFGALAFFYARPLYHSPSSVALRDLGLKLDRTTQKNSLVAAADNGDPTVFYYAQRKGWHFPEKQGIYNGEPMESADLIADLKQLSSRGANYLVFTKDTSWWLNYYEAFAHYLAENATVMERSAEFRIYQLRPVETSR
jgi:4-amino-4-deoxy-L-arabinose transferase-like glycosyltransferase